MVPTDQNREHPPTLPGRITSLPPSFYYIPNFITPEEESTLLSKIPPNRWITLSHRRLQAHPTTLSAKDTLLASPLPSWLSSPILSRFQELGVFDNTLHGAPNHVLVNEYRPGEGIMPHEDGAAYAPVVATVSLGGAVVLDVYEKRGKGSGCRGESGESSEIREGGGEATITRLEADTNGTQNSTPGISANSPSQPSSTKQPLQPSTLISTPTNSPSDTPNQPKYRILQEPRSLLVTTDQAYTSLLHGIAPIAEDTDLGSSTVANWSLLGDQARYASGRNTRGTRTSLTYRDVLKTSKIGSSVLGVRRG